MKVFIQILHRTHSLSSNFWNTGIWFYCLPFCLISILPLARPPIIVFHQEIISLSPITQRLPSRTKRHKPQNVTRNRTRNMLPWKSMFCLNHLQGIFCFRKCITVNRHFKGYAAQRTVEWGIFWSRKCIFCWIILKEQCELRELPLCGNDLLC